MDDAANGEVGKAAMVRGGVELERSDERILDSFRGGEVVVHGGFDGAAGVDASDEGGEEAGEGVVRRAVHVSAPGRLVFDNRLLKSQ